MNSDKLKTPQVVDQDAETFECNGTTFYIYTKSMGPDRVERFLELAPTMQLGFEMADAWGFIADIYQQLCTAGQDKGLGFMGDISAAINRLGNVVLKTRGKKPGDISKGQVEAVLDMCALFIVLEGEDMSVLDERIFKVKKQMWRDHMDFHSLFFFAVSVCHLFATRSDNISESAAKVMTTQE